MKQRFPWYSASIHQLALIFVVWGAVTAAGSEVLGEPKQWHKLVIAFAGPELSEAGTPNPFLDYRLDVDFTGPSGRVYRVPGYFAADGNAAESGATAGRVWQVAFPPDEPGSWRYRASFVKGPGIAARFEGGERVGFFDGESGTFTVAPTDQPATGRDLRGKGKLVYAGGHYLRFLGSGESFLKAGANSPEVFLQYREFDNTPSDRVYAAHVRDWRPGDPTWRDGRGKGIIGVVNYLAEVGINSVYFLTMNHQGDGKQAWPWIGTDTPDRYDVSKLAQWERVFDHFDRRGMMLHFVLTETENEAFFEMAEDGKPGGFADLRKVYYREMVARFGHHLAITWNLGEENGWDTGEGIQSPTSDRQRKAFSTYLRQLTPYRDHIVVHNGPSGTDTIFETLTGHQPITGPSIQWNYEADIHGTVGKWRLRSREAGHPWVATIDEPYIKNKDDADVETWRKNILWGSLMAGGAGAEFYIGSGDDLRVQDYRAFERYYRPASQAVSFLQAHVPFQRMGPDDGFAPGAWTLKSDGEVYLLYLPNGGSTRLRLPDGAYRVRWFDPRNGGDLKTGSVSEIQGGPAVSVGSAPRLPDRDWVVLVERL